MDRIQFLEEQIRPRQSQLWSDLNIQDGGGSIWTKNPNIELSKGCQACKSGTWLCCFVGNHCNVSCPYCPQGSNDDKNSRIENDDAMQAYWIDDIKRHLDISPSGTYTGVSYSGGEPFMYISKIINLANYIAKNHPTIYQWIYTNGLLASESKMKILQDLAIQEIRFHLSASNFNPIVLDNVKLACDIFPFVTIENPAIPELKKFLIDDENIKRLEQMGVKQFNLAEVYCNNEFNRNYFTNYPMYYYTSSSRGLHESPQFSRNITYDIIEFVIKNNIDIIVNDCSHEARDVQIIKKSFNPYRRIQID